MKSKNLQLLTIGLLLLFTGAGCQEEEWKIIELNDNVCDNTLGVLNSFTDYTGTINTHPENTGDSYFIFIDTPKDIAGAVFFPCNLPEEYHQKELKIIFSGEFLNIEDWENGSQPDLLGTPFKLTNAKIKTE